jgi:hypothetical protein
MRSRQLLLAFVLILARPSAHAEGATAAATSLCVWRPDTATCAWNLFAPIARVLGELPPWNAAAGISDNAR